MQSLEMVKRLSIEMGVNGEEKVSAALKQIADQSSAVVLAFEKSSKSIGDSTKAYERLARQIDPMFRSQEKIAQGQRVLDTALREGVIDATRYASSLEMLHTKYKNVAESLKQINPPPPDRAADIAAYGQELDRIRAKFSPLFSAQQQYRATLNEINQAAKVGAINEAERAAALQRTKDAFANQVRAIQGATAAENALAATHANLSHNTGMVAAQFQDIAVQLAGGQSPFLIALQQGTQLSGTLGDQGIKGALKTLAGGFLSLLNPVSLATIGMIGLGGAAFQYLTGAGEEVESVDDKLKRHADLIASLKPAYGKATEGLEQYASESRTVLEAQLAVSMDSLKASLEARAREIEELMSTAVPVFTDIATGAGFGGADLQVREEYKAFADTIGRLKAEAISGTPNVRAFREAVSEAIRTAGDNTKIRELGGELLKASEDALKLEQALTAAERSLKLLNSAAGAGIGNLEEYRAALKSLSERGLPDLSDRQRALQDYQKAIASAGGLEERRAALESYDTALGRIADRERERAEEEARKEAERAAKRVDDYERAVRQIQDQNRDLQIQVATFRMGTGEAAKYRTEQELLVAAQRAQRELTPGLRAEIEQLAASAGMTAERMEELREHTRLAQELEGIPEDAFKGILSDLRQGKSFADAMANALDRLIDKLLDLAIDSAFDKEGGLFGFLQALMSGKNPFSVIPPVSLGSMVTGAPFNTGGNVQAQGIGANIAGSFVPAMRSAITEATKAATSVAATAAASIGRSTVEAYVREAASIRGIDPDIAARVIKQESSFNPAAYNPEGSYGVMQLYTKGGLGNEALKRGISLDPSNWREQVDFGFDIIKKDGWRQWHGARDIGIGRWEGIPRGPQAFNGMAGNDNLIGSAGKLSQGFDDLSQTTSQLSPSLDAFGTDFKALAQTLQGNVPQLSQNLTQLGTTTAQGGQMVGGALDGTADVIGQGANGIGNAILQLGQALSSMGGGVGFGSFLSGLVGGGNPFTNGGRLDWGQYMGGVTYAGMHNGGLVGRDVTFTRAVDPSVFANAPRYHSGLRPDEVPTILQRGEWVLSRDDVSGIKNAGRGGGANDNGSRVTVHNYGPTEAHVEEREDGSIEVYVDALEARFAEKAAKGKGQLYKGVVGRTQGKSLRG